jgi:hypothetical protein
MEGFSPVIFMHVGESRFITYQSGGPYEILVSILHLVELKRNCTVGRCVAGRVRQRGRLCASADNYRRHIGWSRESHLLL